MAKADKPRWQYAFNCRKCEHIQYVNDPATGRDGDYCIPGIERYDKGLSQPIHADDDYIVRCDCYQEIVKEDSNGCDEKK